MSDFWQRWAESEPLDDLPDAPEEAAPEAEAPIDWMAELSRELGFQQANGGAFGQAIPQGPKHYSSAQGFTPGMVPEDFETYRALVHQVFDAKKRQLCAESAKQPMFRAAFETWRPGQAQANLNILYEVFDKLAALLGRIYQFHPAPIGYDPSIGDFSGLYNKRFRRVMLSQRLLAMPVAEVFDTIAHEQIHKLQHEMVLRLDFPSRTPLTLPERSLALYWVREEPRIRQLYARGLHDAKQGRNDAAYRRIGVEYHAYDTGEALAGHLKSAFGY